MHTTGTFTVDEFSPTDWTPGVRTGLDVGHAILVKSFFGGVDGRSATQFSFAFDNERGIGTYVAMESFEGSLDGRSGTFNFAHSATTDGQSTKRLNEFVVIVPGSGTGELEGITGTGALTIDADGTHHFSFDYELAEPGPVGSPGD